MATKVATIVVAGLSTTTRYVDKFLVECYTDSGLTNLVTTKFVGAVWDGSTNNVQKGLITFKGLTFGTTYYFRAGVVAPITGSTAWSATYSLVAGSATGPSAVTYTGNYEATTSGIAYTITPASVPTDIDHYELIWKYDGSVPASSDTSFVTVAPATTLTFFAGGKPGDRVSAYVRAVNTSHQQQVWTSLGTVGIALVRNDAIVHQGTSPGTSGYSYRQFSTAAYTLVSGDRLEYDVYEEVIDPQFLIGVDFHYTTGGGGRFTGTVISDQNAVSNAVTTDLSGRVKGRWYHREFNLTSLAGKAIDSWATFLEGDTAGNYKAQFANIRVMNGTTLKLQVFGTGAVPTTTVWTAGPGENYTSVLVHTAQTSVGSINTAQIIDQAVVGTKAALTASARDINKNLFGDPTFGSQSGTVFPAFSTYTSAMSTNIEKWYYSQDGTSPTDTPDFRNHGEARICKTTATGGTKVVVGQFKKFTRFYSGLNYSVRVWVRINAGDATPNGNFNITFKAYDASGNLVSTVQTNTNPGSAITSTQQLAVAYWQPYNLVSGAQYYSVEFENTSTNTDLYITQPMLNRGTQVSDYTEETYLLDVNRFAYEGYAFVNDGFTGSNGTTIASHYPDTAGFEWSRIAGPGTETFSIQSNKAQLTTPVTTSSSADLYVNAIIPLGAAYYVQGDCTLANTSGFVGIAARVQGNGAYYSVRLVSTGVQLFKRVSSVDTQIGTTSAQTIVAGTSYTLKLVVSTGNQKVYFNGSLVISGTDTAIVYNSSTEQVGFFANSGNSSAATHTIDNFTAVYVQNVGTPPTPPTGTGGGGGDPGGGGSCCVGRTFYETRSGDQQAVDLWQKWVLDEWTEQDDLKTYNFSTGTWEYHKPTAFWASGVQSTFVSSFDDLDTLETSKRHRVFNDLTSLDACKAVYETEPNMLIQLSDNSQCRLTAIEEVAESSVVYYLEMPTYNYVAKTDPTKIGKLCHNLKPLN